MATGYLAMARHFAGGEGEPHLTLEDAIDNVSRAFLGLSVTCARCHDHKFDPISSHDYYALYGIFSSTTFPHPGSEGKNRPANLVPLLPKAEIEQLEKARAEQLAAIEVEKKAADEAKAAAEKEPETPERKAKVDAAAKVAAEVREKRKRLSETPLYPLAYAVSEQRRGECAAAGARRSEAARRGSAARVSCRCSAGRRCRRNPPAAAGWSWRSGSPTRRIRSPRA